MAVVLIVPAATRRGWTRRCSQKAARCEYRLESPPRPIGYHTAVPLGTSDRTAAELVHVGPQSSECPAITPIPDDKRMTRPLSVSNQRPGREGGPSSVALSLPHLARMRAGPDGRPLSPGMLARWISRGVKLDNGHRLYLAAFRRQSEWVTNVECLDAFLAARAGSNMGSGSGG
jgi:hypothetical protein